MSHVKYPLDEEIKKQDLVRMALRMGGIEVPSEYVCQNIYPQISADFPNNWACRVAEIARQKNIISLTNPDFLGDSGLPRIEALEILLKAKNIPLKKSTRSKFSDVTDPKQIQIVNTALALGFVSPNATFRPDEQIMHGEAFYMIKNISKYK